MSSVPFDPYHKWLGIPQREQPVNHYRLLGIELFEEDPQVVEAAADRQMAFLRKYQSGEHGADALKLLNEVSRARICLLKPDSKLTYDAGLRAELGAKSDKSASAEQIAVSQEVLVESLSSSKPVWLQLPVLVGGGVAIAVLIAAGILFSLPKSTPTDGQLPKPAPDVAALNNQPASKPDKATDKVQTSNTDKTTKLANQDRPLATGNKAPWPTLLDDDPDEAKKPGVKSTKPGTKTKSQVASSSINVLADINVARDQIQGKWHVEDGQLCTPVGFRRAAFNLRTTMPDEYDLNLTVTRRAGEGLFFLGFPIQGQQAGFDLDGWGGSISGIDTIDGQRTNTRLEVYKEPVLLTGEKVQLVAQIRKDSITLTADGKQIVDWKGDPTQLSVDELYKGRDNPSLFVGADGADFAISRCEVVPVASSPLAPKPRKTRSPIPGEIDLLSRLDIDRDAAEGSWTLNSAGLNARAPDVAKPARLSIPYRPAAQYDLRLTIERQSLQGEFLIGLPVQGHQCLVVLDAGRNRDISGLSMIDNKLATRNETQKKTKVLEGGEQVDVVCQVRRDAIKVLANNAVIVDWKGYADRLSPPAVIPFVDPLGLMLAVNGGGTFQVDDVKLIPVTDTGATVTSTDARTTTGRAGIEGSLQITKQPTPDAAAQEAALKKVKERYKVEYALAKKAEGRNLEPKTSLARTLFARALETDNDPAAAYVMLSDAAEFAAEAGQLGLAWEILVSLGDQFDVPSLPLMERAAKSATPFAKNPEEITMLGSMYVLLLEQAVQVDDFETASKASQAATSVTRKIPVLKEQLAAVGRRTNQLREAYELAKPARDLLKTSPDDAAANQTWGTYLCFHKADWGTGLPLLAKATDAELANLAKRDLDQPRDVQALSQLGDEWWEVSDRHKEPMKSTIRDRAADLWQLALLTATGPAKSALDQKIAKLFGTTKFFETTGAGGGVGVANADLNPGPFFTVEFWVTTQSDTGILIAKRQDARESTIFISLENGRPTVGGRGPYRGPTARGKTRIDDGRWHHIAVVKLGNKLGLFVDGKTSAQTDYSEALLSASPWKLGYEGQSSEEEPRAKFCRLRFSKEARYLVNFNPEKTYAKDKGTIFIP